MKFREYLLETIDRPKTILLKMLRNEIQYRSPVSTNQRY
jgi:hypothetical protein